MLVEIAMDPMGHVTVHPVSERLRRKYAAHLATMGQNPDASIYLQADYDIEEFLAGFRPAVRNDVNSGYTVRCRMDQWEFATMLGDDCNTI